MSRDHATAHQTGLTPFSILSLPSSCDYKRFFDTIGKHLVFYSESSGFYKYFQGAIEWLLANSDIRIHYVTSDPNDQYMFAQKLRNEARQ